MHAEERKKVRLNLRKSTDALTPAFAAIMVTLVVTSTVGTVVFWGVPYVDTLNEKREQENVDRQVDAVVDSIADLAGSRPGHTDTTYVATGDSGSVSVDQDEDRLVLMYSYSSQYNFNVSGLSLDDEQSDVFTINLPNGLSSDLCSRAVISWLDFDTCFLAGTKIVMADGSYKNIEDIKIGDIVKSYDTETKMLSNCMVSHVYHHTPEEMTEYYLVINDQLGVTPNHRFYSEYEWVYAGDLKVGDSLFCMEQSMEYSVFSVDRFYERVSTFDLEIEGCHNYFVYMHKDDVDVLVHNGGDIGDGNEPDITWYEPGNDSGGLGTSVTLQATVVHPMGDPMVVEFWNYNNLTAPLAAISINSGETASYTWPGLELNKTYKWNLTIYYGGDYKYPTEGGYFWFRTNKPPEIQEYEYPPDVSPFPVNNTGMIQIPVPLSVKVYDPDVTNDVVVRFYNYNTSELIGTYTLPAGSGDGLGTSGYVSVQWSGISYNTTYWWNVSVSDGYFLVKSDWWTFKTKPKPNQSPNEPTNVLPFDGAIDIDPAETLTLKVTVFDIEGDSMDVTFMNASSYHYTHIETKYNVSNGEVSINWTDLEYNKEYRWYVTVYDGKSSLIVSDIWSFKTMKETDETDTRFSNEWTWNITTNKPLEGAVVIKLYNADYTRFGKIFIFDSNSLTYKIHSDDKIENIILENGGIVYSSSESTYVKNGLSVQEASGFFKLSVVQMVEKSHSSSSVSGMGNIRIITEFKGSAVDRQDAKGETVYHLRLQFSGDHKDIWSNHLNDNYDFAIQSVTDEPDFLIYNNNGIRLMLWHSYIAFSLM
jgi:hypothetical protein